MKLHIAAKTSSIFPVPLRPACKCDSDLVLMLFNISPDMSNDSLSAWLHPQPVPRHLLTVGDIYQQLVMVTRSRPSPWR